MSNFFVIDTDTVTGKAPRLAWKNEINSSTTITATHDAANVGFVYDGLTTAKWRPAATVSSLTFTQGFIDVDYVGIAGVNWNTSITSVAVYDQDNTLIASASGLEDNQPLLLAIPKAIYSSIKIEFNSATNLLEVGEIYIGETMQFPWNVSIGYRPGRWTFNDKITWSRTESNQFGGSIIRARGTSETFSIKFIPISFMDTDYKRFIKDARGKAVFFLWDKDKPHEAVYGHWDARDPSFNSSLYSSISLTIKGVA